MAIRLKITLLTLAAPLIALFIYPNIFIQSVRAEKTSFEEKLANAALDRTKYNITYNP